jgi:hypothetical protein
MAAQNDLPTRPQVKNAPEAYPLGYVEDAFKPRTQLEVVFSSLVDPLKVPCNAAHKHPRVSRHEVNAVDRRRLVSQS